MVFSSIPAYLDSSNWHQQQNHHQIIGSSSTNHLLPVPPSQQAPPPPPPPPQPHGSGGPGSNIRPGSMSERARMANIPMPETALKCPRCESTNTKFCYFNNYSLSQPRHFCKTCRRYWTRGGALRSVPVGGGCRRNKRSKSTSSKSPANRSEGGQPTSSSTSSGSGANILGLTPQLPPLRFMSPLSQFTDNYNSDVGLNNYSGISGPMVGGSSEMNFNNNGGGMASFLSSGINEQWRMQQQFPFMGGFDLSSYGAQFQGGGGEGFLGGGDVGQHHQMMMRPKLSSSMLTQMASVKMEDNPPHELNLSRQFLGGGGGGLTPQGGNNNNYQWNSSTANWTDLSSFSSSSTSNPL
ncbi:hypothetical protein ACJIZ3_022026 [Penstemon smallii]|uniref:Dof zinc finger protein n=1 Tax=Penstemon smallii TaxID=265156 RepID=A0ABD3SP02_9LAMI